MGSQKTASFGIATLSRRISNPYLEPTPSQIYGENSSCAGRALRNIIIVQAADLIKDRVNLKGFYRLKKDWEMDINQVHGKEPSIQEKLRWVGTGRLASRTLSFGPMQIYGHRGLAAPTGYGNYVISFRLMSVTTCTVNLKEKRRGRMVSNFYYSLCLSFPLELASVNFVTFLRKSSTDISENTREATFGKLKHMNHYHMKMLSHYMIKMN
ncbi:rap guanine nucleotide exchange factor 5 [Pontoporia blainvillei]|uniref:Rap guanine nucleotide exchange factor 5 n=1 Tax=Pontoporia blainvillei TaxID=48723 RepID=A0ABX0S767_PONBL|nr:rap guanine nucleotide exchange factor 5 [Pontoporia blainvillei]